MCKGDVLDDFLSRHGGADGFSKMVYIGDGKNDFCPILRMRSGDLALARKGFELDKKIEKDGKRLGLKVDVELWEQAWQIDE